MAGNMDSLTEALTCPVCFEDFEENGDHVPRLLPCTHSLCHTCIAQWIRNNRLECPTCKMRHDVRRGGIAFPQNKYILTMMRRRTRLQGEEMDEARKCPKHEEKEILFCREVGCQKMICPLCLSEGHLGHKVVAVKHETKDVLAKLVQNIQITNEKLNKKITKVEDVSQDVLKQTEANVLRITLEKEKMIRDLERKTEQIMKQHDNMMKQAEYEKEKMIRDLEKKKEEMTKQSKRMAKQAEKEKEEMMKQYDEIIKQAEDEKNTLSETSGNELTAMKDNMEFLTNIKQSIEEEENTYEDAIKKLDTVKGVTETVEQFPRVKKYEYSEYLPGQENLVGKLMKKEKYVFPARQLQGEVRQNFATGFEALYNFWMTTLNDGTVAVRGRENNQRKLKRFSLETGRELSSVNMNCVYALTEVNLGVNSVIAVSDSKSNKIEFRNRENLKEIVLTHSVAPHQPGALCSISTSVLVYEDSSKSPQHLHWLDCSEAKPKLLGITVNSNLNSVQDMCVVQLETEKLLIAISCNKNELIQVFNSTTGELKWSAPKKIPSGTFQSYGVAGDGNGRLFVADITNYCIQMFSASDGQYLGCLMKREDQGLGYPRRLQWSEVTSSLLVAHLKDGIWSISDIH